MLYAALGPKGYSDLHWRSQSKLNRPILRGSALCFTSSSSFSVEDAEAWWVAFDLAAVLDKELQSSNAILTDIDQPTFAAQRVAGADSPSSFSKFVRTSKWRPIDASIRVTDPLSLAKTLGGKNLYGPSALAPFRELIQNAADAIRARRALEGRGQEFGVISVTVEAHASDEELCWVHVDDNGIGMSERVISTALVDFGRSFWTSGLIRQEFPGLRSKNFNHIGRFGIGFFSVFDVAREVKVTSRRFDASHQETRSLEFFGLISRPLLKEAKASELPVDVSTRVSISVKKELTRQLMEDEGRIRHIGSSVQFGQRSAMFSTERADLQSAVRGVSSFLDVNVVYSDFRNGDKFNHGADVYGKTAGEFIDDLPGSASDKNRSFFDPSTSMQPVVSENGDSFGRAALDIDSVLEHRSSPMGFVSVGGIVSSGAVGEPKVGAGVTIPFFGVLEGKVERAARDMASVSAPPAVILAWLEDQLNNVDRSVLKMSQQMTVASFAQLAIGSDAGLPFAFNRGEMRSSKSLFDLARSMGGLSLPLEWRYENWPEMIGYDQLRSEYFEASLRDEVVVLSMGSNRLIDEEVARVLRKNGGGSISREGVVNRWRPARAFVSLIEKAWGKKADFNVSQQPIFKTRIASLSGSRWVLNVSPSPD
jgi:hypothetical protein